MNIQEYAARFANTKLSKLNKKIAEIAGVRVLWFRSLPKKESADVLFQTYTLHNVEKCPLEIYALYSESAYDDAALTFSFNGIDYKPTLTLEIPIATWKECSNNDNSTPQEKDIIYIPLSNKLWQVKSMTPIAAMAGQITSYKTMLETYRPEADRYIGSDLKETIDANTTNIDKLFGEAIEETLLDLTNDKQSSHFSSTERDKYKTLGRGTDTTNIFSNDIRIKTLAEEVNISGHLAARSVYDMNISSDYAVHYKNTEDTITSDTERCLSILVKPYESYHNRKKIASIREISRNRNCACLEIVAKGDLSKINPGSFVNITRNSIQLCGEVTDVTNNTISVKVSVELIKRYDSVQNWKQMSGFEMYSTKPINLLSAKTENGDISIDVLCNKYIVLNMCGKESCFVLNTSLANNMWYGFIINLRKTADINVFKLSPSIERVQSSQKNIDWSDINVLSYYIKPSESYITNIRLYNVGNDDIDKQLEDIVSYNIKNGSSAIINDSADIYIENEYYGEQR